MVGGREACQVSRGVNAGIAPQMSLKIVSFDIAPDR